MNMAMKGKRSPANSNNGGNFGLAPTQRSHNRENNSIDKLKTFNSSKDVLLGQKSLMSRPPLSKASDKQSLNGGQRAESSAASINADPE